jgi:restriction system protein
VLPLKTRSALAVGKVSGPYKFEPEAPSGAKHQRPVKWVRTDIPRGDVDQDILFSLGSTLTVFQVRRSDAEKRLFQTAEGQHKGVASVIPDLDATVTAEDTPQRP